MPQSKRQEAESGQVLVEYILMLALFVSVLVAIQTGLRTSIFKKVWVPFAKEISAACPKGCLPDPKIR